MTDRFAELRAILADVRARWMRRAFLRAWTLGAATAAAMLLVGLLAVWLVARRRRAARARRDRGRRGRAASRWSFALLPLRQPPSDRQIARFIEEQAGGLDDVLVTAVEKGDRRRVADDRSAGGACGAHGAVAAVRVDRHAGHDAAGHGRRRRSAASRWLAASVFFAPSAGRAADVVGAYLFPKRYVIEVMPGSVKVRAGQPLTVVARIPGIDGGLVPDITVGVGEAARSARMAPGAAAGEFAITLNNIETSFPYLVSLGAAAVGTIPGRGHSPGAGVARGRALRLSRRASGCRRRPSKTPATSTRRPARRPT